MPNHDIRFTRLTNVTDGRFDELCSIYENALPARERKNRAALEEMVARDDYRFLIATWAACVVGFATVFLSVEPRFALLEYMAIDREWRGKGIGGALFDQVRGLCCDAEKSGTLLIEVESDREANPDRESRSRRKDFYRRGGCREIAGLDFVLPLPGIGAPPKMDLMICSADPTDLARERVRSWLIAIYTQVYGSSPDDPRIARMLGDSQDALRLM